MNQFIRLNIICLITLCLIMATVPSSSYCAEMHNTLLLAESLIGIPYCQGGSNPGDGFNSTGLIRYISALGKKTVLPKSPSQLWKLGKVIDRSHIQPGDILFFAGSKNLIPAIYTNNNIIIVVATNEGVVKRNIAEHPYWPTRYVGARRYTI